MKDFKTILVAVDFSQSSEYAFQYALSLAKKYDGRLVIIHVVNEPAAFRTLYVPHISFEKLDQEIEESAQKMIEKFCRTQINDYSKYESFVVSGIPNDEIIKKAQEQSVDLIVMGTHGRTGIDHVLFGSTAEKVVRKSPVPVMTVRFAE